VLPCSSATSLDSEFVTKSSFQAADGGRGDSPQPPLHSFAYAGFPPSAVQFTSAKSGLKCGVTFTTSPVSVLNTA
jgi:hypothetical protein